MWRKDKTTEIEKFLAKHDFEKGTVAPKYMNGNIYQYKGKSCMSKYFYDVDDYFYRLHVTEDRILWEMETPWRSLNSSGCVRFDNVDELEEKLDELFCRR